jgi:hypothetical protein
MISADCHKLKFSIDAFLVKGMVNPMTKRTSRWWIDGRGNFTRNNDFFSFPGWVRDRDR